MIELLEGSSETSVQFRLSGKLHDEDYKTFVPLVDESIAAHGRTRILVHFHNFEGWDTHALWDDIKFATTHCTTIERIALVGENKWQKYMAMVCRPFTMAKLQYFDISDISAAEAWVNEA